VTVPLVYHLIAHSSCVRRPVVATIPPMRRATFPGDSGQETDGPHADVGDRLIMNKRTFLKLLAAILGGSSGARLFGRAPDDPASGGQLTNWAGNYRYSTDNLHRLTSIEQIRKFVKEHDSLKVLGTRHSFRHC
jgi:hypothetical protein